MNLDYHLLDVFTRERLTGNPLAVFVDQDVPDAALMQRIARELNLSETVFVAAPAERDACPTRIFTPGNELPFAGHPTVGTAVLLASLGVVRSDVVVLAEGVGDVRVAVTQSDDGVWSGELTTATLPTRTTEISRDVAAAWAGLGVDDLHPDFVPAVWDCGVAFAVVVLRDVATLGRARSVPDADYGVYAVAPVEATPGQRWRARSFVGAFGIPEDPATGSAAAAFAGFVADAARLAAHDRVEIAQGVEMGRPSELHVTFDRAAGGGVQAVRVAGEAVVVGGGTLRL